MFIVSKSLSILWHIYYADFISGRRHFWKILQHSSKLNENNSEKESIADTKKKKRNERKIDLF